MEFRISREEFAKAWLAYFLDGAMLRDDVQTREEVCAEILEAIKNGDPLAPGREFFDHICKYL